MTNPLRCLPPVLAAIGLGLPLWAEDAPDGATIFAMTCAACHGEAAHGDGPMAGILTVPVPDLTGLAAGNGGAFPWLRTLHVVDGRTGLRGHGAPMPLFGELMKGDIVAADAPDGSPVFVSARVLAVVEWLATIQQ
ncbi:MAG: c-type cytochrome [Paracoccaceae bacterium]